MSQITKRQHFVPRTFLKRFTVDGSETEKVWAKNKNNPDKNFSVNIKNVCLQKHLYTIDFAEATESDMMMLEDFYCDNFESSYTQLYQLLTDESITSIDSSTKQFIIDTVISMYYRVAKWFNKSIKEQKVVISEIIEKAKELEKSIIKTPTGETIDISGKSIDEILAELEPGRKLDYILLQLNAFKSSAELFGHYNISVNKTYEHHEFLTSDVPIVLNNGEVRLVEYLDKSCHIMLNISPKHCLTIMPPTGNSNLMINRVYMKDASSLMYTLINNDHQLRNCENLILGSESGMKFFDDCKGIRETKEAVETIIDLAEEEMKGIKDMYNKFWFRHQGKEI